MKVWENIPKHLGIHWEQKIFQCYAVNGPKWLYNYIESLIEKAVKIMLLIVAPKVIHALHFRQNKDA